MKIMCPVGNHHNGFVATHKFGHMMCTVHYVPKCMSCHKAIVVITGGHLVFRIAYIYIYIYMYVCIYIYIYMYLYICAYR